MREKLENRPLEVSPLIFRDSGQSTPINNKRKKGTNVPGLVFVLCIQTNTTSLVTV